MGPDSYIYLAIIYAIEAGPIPVIQAQWSDFEVFRDKPQISALQQCNNKKGKAIEFIEQYEQYGIMTTCKPFRS